MLLQKEGTISVENIQFGGVYQGIIAYLGAYEKKSRQTCFSIMKDKDYLSDIKQGAKKLEIQLAPEAVERFNRNINTLNENTTAEAVLIDDAGNVSRKLSIHEVFEHFGLLGNKPLNIEDLRKLSYTGLVEEAMVPDKSNSVLCLIRIKHDDGSSMVFEIDTSNFDSGIAPDTGYAHFETHLTYIKDAKLYRLEGRDEFKLAPIGQMFVYTQTKFKKAIDSVLSYTKIKVASDNHLKTMNELPNTVKLNESINSLIGEEFLSCSHGEISFTSFARMNGDTLYKSDDFYNHFNYPGVKVDELFEEKITQYFHRQGELFNMPGAFITKDQRSSLKLPFDGKKEYYIDLIQEGDSYLFYVLDQKENTVEFMLAYKDTIEAYLYRDVLGAYRAAKTVDTPKNYYAKSIDFLKNAPSVIDENIDYRSLYYILISTLIMYMEGLDYSTSIKDGNNLFEGYGSFIEFTLKDKDSQILFTEVATLLFGNNYELTKKHFVQSMGKPMPLSNGEFMTSDFYFTLQDVSSRLYDEEGHMRTFVHYNDDLNVFVAMCKSIDRDDLDNVQLLLYKQGHYARDLGKGDIGNHEKIVWYSVLRGVIRGLNCSTRITMRDEEFKKKIPNILKVSEHLYDLIIEVDPTPTYTAFTNYEYGRRIHETANNAGVVRYARNLSERVEVLINKTNVMKDLTAVTKDMIKL